VKQQSLSRCDVLAHSSEHKKGLRTVATLEFTKGVLVLAATFGFVEIIRKDIDLEEAAQNLLYFLHVDAAGRMMDANVATVLAIAFLYSGLRFIEAYGLWRTRVWAEWLAIISGAIYLPFELYSLIRRPTLAHWIILLINIAVVVYVAWVRWDEISARGSVPARFAEDGD